MWYEWNTFSLYKLKKTNTILRFCIIIQYHKWILQFSNWILRFSLFCSHKNFNFIPYIYISRFLYFINTISLLAILALKLADTNIFIITCSKNNYQLQIQSIKFNNTRNMRFFRNSFKFPANIPKRGLMKARISKRNWRSKTIYHSYSPPFVSPHSR